MPDDLRALLAAIVADPADDTARLAYADCLEEHGNAPRATFIRLQIEAERLHSDSNARARLEDRARALLEEHWIDWWGEVCAAIGFPTPLPKPRGRLGRLVRRIGNSAGHPYYLWSLSSNVGTPVGPTDRSLPEWWHDTTFRRGFPCSLSASHSFANSGRFLLQRWTSVSPLEDARLSAPREQAWVDRPLMPGLRSLALTGFAPSALLGVLASPHMGQLESLILDVADYSLEYDLAFADELARATISPRMRQLKRLGIQVWSDPAAAIVASAENLDGLETLEVSLLRPIFDEELVLGSEDFDGQARRLTALARSPHLAGLRELRVIGVLDAAGFEAAIRNPIWTGLRKLDVHAELRPGELLTRPDDLPELEELRLSGVSYTVAQVAAFASSPLLKRLRHFAVRGGPNRSVDFDIAHAVDPVRIETFAIGENELQTGVAEKLRDHFGDRFRVLR
jgi:uncharacterized protein (TIGR02996 family)